MTISREPVDVVVVGAGVIGLAIAHACARSGRQVHIVDATPATGATYAAAGMLAAVSEFHYQEEPLLELMQASAALYPAFIASLGTGTATAPSHAQRSAAELAGFRTTSTLCVGFDSGDRTALADLRAAQRSNGLSVEPLTIREVRAREPMLSPGLSAAYLIAEDHQVDPRALAATLQSDLAALATPIVRHNAVQLLQEPGAGLAARVTGVLLADGSEMLSREVIVANGLGASALAGLPEWLELPLRPVFGDILRLRVPEKLRPLLTATVRGQVRGVPIYLVPRADGTIVIGATQREDGSPTVSAGGVYQLLRDAQQLVPAVAELELLEVVARARPATPDNAPLLGRVEGLGGLIIATGFFRHGVLLAPIAAAICRDLLDGEADARWAKFRPDRFSRPNRSTPAPSSIEHGSIEPSSAHSLPNIGVSS